MTWDQWALQHARQFGLTHDGGLEMVLAWADTLSRSGWLPAEAVAASDDLAMSRNPPQWPREHLGRLAEALARGRQVRAADRDRERREEADMPGCGACRGGCVFAQGVGFDLPAPRAACALRDPVRPDGSLRRPWASCVTVYCGCPAGQSRRAAENAGALTLPEYESWVPSWREMVAQWHALVESWRAGRGRTGSYEKQNARLLAPFRKVMGAARGKELARANAE